MRLAFALFILLVPVINLNAQQAFKCMFDSTVILLKAEKINTLSSEYAPTFFKNGIIFSSNRDHSFGIETYNEADKTRLDDFYFASAGSDSLLAAPEFLKDINTRFQEGTASFDSLSGTLYFTSTIKVKGKMVLTIYQSVLGLGGQWGKPSIVLTPKKAYSYFHPCITNRGNTLLFASDENAKAMGSDLFISTKMNGVWSEPKNIGEVINTEKNEGYPYVDNLGNLFFSSRGHAGFGGYDVFYAENIGGIWQKPVNLGSPLNSSFDDFSLIVDPGKRLGYLATNRSDGLNDDILKFYLLFPLFNNCIGYASPSYCYDFTEEMSLSEQDTAGFVFEWNFGDGEKARGINVRHCYSKPRNYLVELNILEKNSGDLFMNQINYNLEVEETKALHIKCADTVYVGDLVFFDSKGSALNGYSIESYFWNFPNGYMTKSPTVEQFFSSEGEFEVKLAVTAFNDSTGRSKREAFCTSKRIIVRPANQKSLIVRNKEAKTFIGKLKEIGSTIFDLTKVKNPEYSVYMGSSSEKIDIGNLMVDDPDKIRVIYEDSLYRYLYNSKRTTGEIIQEYIKAKKWGNTKAFVVVLSGDSIVPNQLNLGNDFSIKYKAPASVTSVQSSGNDSTPVIKNNTYLIVVNNDPIADTLRSTNPTSRTNPTALSGTNTVITPELKGADKDRDGKISQKEVTTLIDAYFDGSNDFKIGELYRLVELKNSGLTAFPQWLDTVVVFYAFNSSMVDDAGIPGMTKLISQYKHGTVSDFVLIGFADSVGSEDYNLILSGKRCKSIEDKLSVNGVPRSKIKSFSYGEVIPAKFERFVRKLELHRCVLIVPRIIKSTKK